MTVERATITKHATAEINRLIDRFEQAHADGSAEIENYLPPRDDALYPAVVTELSRIDMEFRLDRDESVTAGDYLQRFPEVFAESANRMALAFEEYRLRRWTGQEISADEIARRYDVDASHWPALQLGNAGKADSQLRMSQADLHPPNVRYPNVGDTVAGYVLEDRLGEGAYSRVFVARQTDLAERQVVLKFTPHQTDESDRLARLQHTNIIPVYSVHRFDQLSCICMPLLGAATVADLSPLGETWASLDGPAVELVSTIIRRRRTTIVAASPGETADRQRSADEAVAEPIDPQASALLNQYSQLKYTDALLAIAIGAAEGLAYAHQRGIIHRDLKPHNILIGDDGTPILLDFNLAVSQDEVKAKIIGGTLPYMSPQQLAAMTSEERPDPSDDVFSFGVILYEIFSGKLPFACGPAEAGFDLAETIQQRKITPIPLRDLNRNVRPGLEAIVNRCLAPNRNDRYRDAVELLDDLKRQRDHLPLAYAPNTSAIERATKWVKRHPQMTSSTFIVTVASLLLLLAAGLFVLRGERISNLQAEIKYEDFQDQFSTTVATLTSPGNETEFGREGISRAEDLIGLWFDRKGSTNISLVSNSDFDHLPKRSQLQLRNQLGQLAFLSARAESAGRVSGDELEHDFTSDRNALQWNALQWNTLAVRFDLDLQTVAGLQRQRLLGAWSDQSDRKQNPLEDHEAMSPEAAMLWAFEMNELGRLQTLASGRIADQPTNFTLWSFAAVAAARERNWEKAITLFDVCDSLRPQTVVTLFNRGLCYLETGDGAAAAADFSACLQIRPAMLAARFNRAVALQQSGDLDAALDDLDQLVASGQATTRMVLMRRQVHLAIGNDELAAKDLALALEIAPRDANDWVSRGVHRLPSDANAALTDFRQALDIDPDHYDALQNCAHVHSDILDQPGDAITYLNRMVRAWPKSPLPIASRGIVYGRLKQTDLALSDADRAKALNPGPRECLQVAGIYALALSEITDQAATDSAKSNAIDWLRRAMRGDPALALVAARDSDLANLQSDPSFRAIVGGAAQLLPRR